ncbi:tetratricopeptide repeat protein 4 [Octopus sinensis]|uniref:Tetratricopeptide repeat protein 4 n=1 Tax=Octopus sinensis TaxID=2607531 RepID=A0A6P7T159_9MOLL|nr:tetratricopeptide repeat protein 4 [Octopus sinensis]
MSSNMPQSKNLTESIAEKVDEELDDFLNEMMKKSKKTAETEDKSIEEIIAELETHPAFLKEIDPSKPLHPAVEALQALKYESENPFMKADSFKEEGNYLFKKRDYRTAVANYTEGIKVQAPDRMLNASLYCNRAASHYQLGNFGYALFDCVMACKFKEQYLKAFIRGSQCCIELKKFSDAIKWCEAGLKFEPENEKLSALKEKSLKLKKIQDRDLRKQQLQERKADVLESKLFNEIHKRHIKMKTDKQNGKTILSLSDLEGSNPGGAKVYLDDAGLLHWPVLFMYPEYNQSDFIESFSENHCFSDHILEMFQSCMVPWDEEHKYVPENIEIYFEENKTESLFRIPPEKSLLEILQHENFTVIGGTPAFILLVANSKFKGEFLKHYTLKSL